MEVRNLKFRATKFVLGFGDLYAADTSIGHTLVIPNNVFLFHLQANVKTAFVGVTSPTVKVGHADDTDAIIKEQSVSKAGMLIPGWPIDEKSGCSKMDHPMSTATAPDLLVTVASSSGNLTSLTAGELEFVVVYAYE